MQQAFLSVSGQRRSKVNLLNGLPAGCLNSHAGSVIQGITSIVGLSV